ncbi:uncharacterized protein PAC_10573 [Phialocephala subalpina]|uniref:Uncharacterized protein n=1 Tax=Phialocephala subalpina TaxID=576137 RepID=A0A1L7X6N4_9HELO|nr:uncharacterized protein PAC_10573 [Phialocephala subalpina]
MVSSSLSFHFSSHLRSANLPIKTSPTSRATEDKNPDSASPSSVSASVASQQQSESRKPAIDQKSSNKLLNSAR